MSINFMCSAKKKKILRDITAVVSNLSHSSSGSCWIARYTGMHSIKCVGGKMYMCVQRKDWSHME